MDDDTTRPGQTERLDQTQRVVRLRGPADVLGVLPYRLGFHPTESLVLVCLEGPRRRDRLVMRVDLAHPATDADLAADLAGRAARVGAAAVLAVVYTAQGDDDEGLVRSGLVDALRDELAEHGLDLPEALLVRAGRWWSYLCHDLGCCPPEGVPLPPVPTAAATRFAAETVAQGEVVLADREELRRTVEPSHDDGARAGREQAVLAAEEVLAVATSTGGRPAARELTLARLAAVRRRWERGDGRVAADDAALVVLGLRDKPTRDAAMTAVLDDGTEALLGLLAELARWADDLEAAPVCTVLAWVAYTSGHGALASIAVERALRCEPDYAMALLLRDGMDRMVPPAALREVSAAVRAEQRQERAG